MLGDLNDFEWTTPLQEIARPPLENLMLRIPSATATPTTSRAPPRCSTTSSSAPVQLAKGAEVEELHLNSDCADPLRTSDHDPLVVRLEIRP